MQSETLGRDRDRLFLTCQTLQEFARIAEKGVSAANQPYAEQGDPANWSLDKYGTRKKWYGSDSIKSLADIRAILDGGWKEGADRLTDLARDLGDKMPAAKTRKRKAEWKDDGADLDVDRALAGQWDTAFRDSRRVWTSGPTTVALNVSWGGHFGQSAEDLFWSGAVLAVLCDLLENAGYAVELNAFILTKPGFDGDEGCGVNQIVIKAPNEALRIDALAGIVCHAGVFRTLGFRTLLQTPWDIGSGLGSMSSWDYMDPKLEALGRSPEGVRINSCTNRESAVREISRVLASIQGE